MNFLRCFSASVPVAALCTYVSTLGRERAELTVPKQSKLSSCLTIVSCNIANQSADVGIATQLFIEYELQKTHNYNRTTIDTPHKHPMSRYDARSAFYASNLAFPGLSA